MATNPILGYRREQAFLHQMRFIPMLLKFARLSVAKHQFTIFSGCEGACLCCSEAKMWLLSTAAK